MYEVTNRLQKYLCMYLVRSKIKVLEIIFKICISIVLDWISTFEYLLQIYNRYSSFWSSAMIFWRVTMQLHCLSIYFPFYRFVKIIEGRMVRTLWFISSTDNRRTSSIPVQSLLLWAWMSSTQLRLFVR